MGNRNASIIMDIMRKKVYKLETCELTCPCSNYEVKNYKEDIDVEKEKLIIKTWYKKKEIMSKQHESEQ